MALFVATYPGAWRDGDIEWRQFLLLAGEMSAVHAADLLRQIEAVNLGSGALQDKKAYSQLMLRQRELRNLAFGDTGIIRTSTEIELQKATEKYYGRSQY